MKTCSRLSGKSPWLTLLIGILALPLIALPAAAQSSGPVINTCSSQVIDQIGFDQIEETACLFGDASQMSYSITLNNSDADIQAVPGLGARAEISGYDGDFDWQQELGDSQITVSDSFAPVPNTTYTLNGWASECIDQTGMGDTNNCYWNDDFADVQVQAQLTGAPAAPANVTATAGVGQVSLSWDGVSGTTSYNVYEGTASGGEGSTPVATNIMNAAYVITGLTNGTTYYFEATAVGNGGESGFSNEVIATPQAVSLPTPTIVLSSSLNPATYNTTITFTVSVTSNAGTPTGTVAFYDGSNLLGTSPLSGSTATWSVSSLAVGSHAITANYQGNSQFQSATSSLFTEMISTSGGSCPVGLP